MLTQAVRSCPQHTRQWHSSRSLPSLSFALPVCAHLVNRRRGSPTAKTAAGINASAFCSQMMSYQRSATSVPGRKACSLVPARVRRCPLHVVAFKASAHELHAVSQQFPSAFITPNRAPRVAPLSPKLTYHSSVFYRDHMESCSCDKGCNHFGLLHGPDAYHNAISTFQAAYTLTHAKPLKLWTAVTDDCQDIFFAFVTKLQNTGSYAGQPATHSSSVVHGVYHLQLNEEGKVEHAWCFRGPTSEERKYLLKAPLPQEPVWPSILHLQPCTWECDDKYMSHVRQSAMEWAHEVQGKGCIQALARLAHDEVTVYEGASLHSADPMVTIGAMEGDMLVRRHTWTLGPLELLASAAQENRAFVHWSQSVTHRKSGNMSQIEGNSLLVFDKHGKVVQVLDYHTPNSEDRERLFKAGTAAAKQPQLVVGGSVQSGLGAEAIHALARQEQEWMSF